MKTVATARAARARCLAATGAPGPSSRVSVVLAHFDRDADLRLGCAFPDADARAFTDERGCFRHLRDGSHLTHAAPVIADHLPYVKALLPDWLQRELRASAGS